MPLFENLGTKTNIDYQGAFIENSQDILKKYMEDGVENKKHLGLSFASYSQDKTLFYNYGVNNGVAITENNFFELASIGKIFTSILILKLEKKGLLAIDNYLEDYIPEFPVKTAIKLRDLLSHTSGLAEHPQSFSFIPPQNSYLPYTHDMLIKDIKTTSIEQQKLGAFNYSSYNYILLGEVIRRVMNKKVFLNALTSEVLQPLGLRSIKGYLSKEEVNSVLINGHAPDLTPVSPYLDLGEVYSSTGALKATIKDLLLFSKMLIGKAYVPDEFKPIINKLLETQKDKNGIETSLGFHVQDDQRGLCFYHAGSVAGNKTIFVISPRNNTSQVYVSTTLSHVKILWDLFYNKT